MKRFILASVLFCGVLGSVAGSATTMAAAPSVARAAYSPGPPVAQIPAWWNGMCDGNGSTPAGASWNGLVACGPDNNKRYESGPLSLNVEWECVELSERWLYQRFGLPQQSGGGGTYGNGYHTVTNYWNYIQSHPGNRYPLQLVTPQSAGWESLGPGDVVSYGGYPTGHTDVVISTSPAPFNGNGTITTLNQNINHTAAVLTLKVTNWNFNVFGMPATGWLHYSVPPHSAVALIPNDGASGYRVDGVGNLQAFGNAPPVTSTWGPTWTVDVVRGIAITPRSSRFSATGYVLDAYGLIHPFAAGGADLPPTPTVTGFWNGWDIARGIVLRSSFSGYVLDGYGGVHPFAAPGTSLPPIPTVTGYWNGWDIARGIVLTTAVSGYVLDGYGGVHPFTVPGVPMPPNPTVTGYWNGWDIARGITLSGSGAGYVLDGWGGIHSFTVPGISMPRVPNLPGSSPGYDTFRGIVVASDGTGADVTSTAIYAWHT